MNLGFFSSKTDSDSTSKAMHNQCDAVGEAMGKGSIGDTFIAVQQLILKYYDNVRDQADESFQSARTVSFLGFMLLIVTVGYVIFMDYQVAHGQALPTKGMGVGAIGLIGGSVVELIAGVQFVLYGRATKQFGAFHICLERTHRYVLAYEMADQISTNKDATLEKVVCIMANAPMITREDIDGVESGATVRPRIVVKDILPVATPLA
jgi:hypothetical protein